MESEWPIEIAITGADTLPDGRMTASFLWPDDRPLLVGYGVKFLLAPIPPSGK